MTKTNPNPVMTQKITKDGVTKTIVRPTDVIQPKAKEALKKTHPIEGRR
jgi:hypothetical protein